MCRKTGQKRVLTPSELGKVARFLCKDGKSITGMSINVDFGIHLGNNWKQNNLDIEFQNVLDFVYSFDLLIEFCM